MAPCLGSLESFHDESFHVQRYFLSGEHIATQRFFGSTSQCSRMKPGEVGAALTIFFLLSICFSLTAIGVYST